jgi:pSer/pThr/pTyr-binding forkhead associated (FHA) protein
MADSPTSLFASHCETRPFQLAVTLPSADGGRTRNFAFRGPSAVAGSDPRCDLRLNRPGVESRHALFQALGPFVLCLDLSEGSGIEGRNGRARAVWIDDLSAVHVGPYHIRAATTPVMSRRAATQTVGAACETGVPEIPVFKNTLAPVTVEFASEGFHRRWHVRQPVAIVGRAHDCTFRINDARIARYQCALVCTPMGLWAVDLLPLLEAPSRRGLRLDGSGTRLVHVTDDTLIELGPYQMRARYDRHLSDFWARRKLGTVRRAAVRAGSRTDTFPTAGFNSIR